MTRFTPLWQQGGSYSAQVDRGLIATLWPTSASAGAPAATVANTMTVSIPPGVAAVALTSGQNSALCRWDAAEVVTSPAAPASGNTRIDLVVLQVRDPQLDAGVNNDFIFLVVAGTPTTGVPVAPTVPANAMAICRYTVPAAVANLNGVTVIDSRGPVMPSATQELAYAENPAAVLVNQTTEAAANLVVAAPAVTFDGVTPVVVECFSPAVIPGSVAGTLVFLLLYQDSASLGKLGVVITPVAAQMAVPAFVTRRLTPTAGSHQFSFAAFQQGGSGQVVGGTGGLGNYVPNYIRIRKA
jgi:hypothetical protein